MSADVKDYSRLMEQDEMGTVRAIKECRSIFSRVVNGFNGRIVDSPGDNILIEFMSAVHAVECSLHIQEELKVFNSSLPENRRMEFRIGINLGDVLEDGERIYGDGVNIAARIERLAQAGGVCISGTVYDQVETKLKLYYTNLGVIEVKNIAKPIRAFSINTDIPKTKSRLLSIFNNYRWKAVVTILIVLLLVVVHRYVFLNELPPSFSKNPAIAVLPFVDLSLEKDQEYFSDGLTEELLNILSQIPGLRVVARTSSFQFKGKNEDVREIGKKLNVPAILEGSVRKEGQRIRITTQLIDATNGFHLWSEEYDFELKDIFAVQDEIAQSLAGILKLTLMSGKTHSGHTGNSDAYSSYLLGQYYLGRRNKIDMGKAIGYYNHALILDPDYALAWVALAVAYIRQADWGYAPVDEGYKNGREAVEKALTLDPELALAHSLLGRIKMGYDWDWAGAESSIKHSLLLAPNDPRVLGNAAALFTALGQVEQGAAMLQQVAELDPLNVTSHYNHAVYSYYGGYFDESIKAIDKALALNSKAAGLHLTKALILLAQSKLTDALAETELETDPGWRLYGISLVQYALDNKELADSALTQFIADYQFDSAFQIAGVYAFRGEFDSSFTWLERAYKQRDSGLPLLKVDPLIRRLSKDPRYLEFLQKMQLPV